MGIVTFIADELEELNMSEARTSDVDDIAYILHEYGECL